MLIKHFLFSDVLVAVVVVVGNRQHGGYTSTINLNEEYEVLCSLHILKNKEISATIVHKNEKQAITLLSYLKYTDF